MGWGYTGMRNLEPPRALLLPASPKLAPISTSSKSAIGEWCWEWLSPGMLAACAPVKAFPRNGAWSKLETDGAGEVHCTPRPLSVHSWEMFL